jgi:hypothetical protein
VSSVLTHLDALERALMARGFPATFSPRRSSSRKGNDATIAHATAFDAGDTSFQQVAYAPTWVANQSITEAETHELEPDLRIWAREYEAIPQASVLAALDCDQIDACFGRPDDIEVTGTPVMIADASSGRGDCWSWGVCQWCRTTGDREVLVFSLVDGLSGKFSKTLTGDAVVDKLAAVCREYGVTQVHGDQRESFMLRSAFRRRDLDYRVHDWTAPRKQTAVERLRRWLSDGSLILPPHDRMKREMHAFEEKISPSSGGLTYGARGSGHDDYVALLLTCAMADLVRGIRAPKAPIEKGRFLGAVHNYSVIDGTYSSVVYRSGERDEVTTGMYIPQSKY